MKRQKLPVAVTIAGSDSGGGAGIQADLKTFSALGVHGTTVITCITAQNPESVLSVQEVSPQVVIDQMKAVFEKLKPSAAKTGMLFSEAIINVVAEYFTENKPCPLVVDPVMVATSGAKLLKDEAISALTKKLFPVAILITPNLDEASVLLNKKIETIEDFRSSARRLYEKFGCPTLVKGGHLKGISKAIDIFYDGKSEFLFSSTRIKNVHTHGTGCTFSAAITAALAYGMKIDKAVQVAKKYISGAIESSVKIARYTALNHNWIFRKPGSWIF